MGRVKKSIANKVYQRANGCCEYCQILMTYVPDPYVIEHIIPISKGGTNDLDNLALSCHGCNNTKYNKTEGIDAITGKKAPLFHPRNDKWDKHFKWNEDFTKMIGISPKGRVTIEILKVNREELLNLRNLLALVGEHPPK